MPLQGHVVLVGPMGAGKSTIATHLSQQLHVAVIDLDDCIVQSSARSIPEIFQEFGEEYFRKLETQCLKESLNSSNFSIIATGGGICMKEENRVALKNCSHAFTIYLNADVDTQYERVKGDTNRPMIANVNAYERLHELYSIRHPLFEQMADLQILTQGLSVAEVIVTLRDALHKAQIIA